MQCLEGWGFAVVTACEGGLISSRIKGTGIPGLRFRAFRVEDLESGLRDFSADDQRLRAEDSGSSLQGLLAHKASSPRQGLQSLVYRQNPSVEQAPQER